jgi:hypothetical protein
MLVSLVIDSSANRPVVALVAAVSFLLLTMAVVAPWKRLPRPAQGLLVLVPIPLIGVASGGDDPLSSHLVPVLLAPLLWLALYETRRCLTYGLILATMVVVVELAQGPTSDNFLHGLVLVSMAVILLPAVSKLVTVNRMALLELAELADRDALTGLVNRRGLERRTLHNQHRERRQLKFVQPRVLGLPGG